jgi:hypothetical protein
VRGGGGGLITEGCWMPRAFLVWAGAGGHAQAAPGLIAAEAWLYPRDHELPAGPPARGGESETARCSVAVVAVYQRMPAVLTPTATQ